MADTHVIVLEARRQDQVCEGQYPAGLSESLAPGPYPGAWWLAVSLFCRKVTSILVFIFTRVLPGTVLLCCA